MNTERIVYAKRGTKNEWTRISFQEIAINEDFILCEPDGIPVGHYHAMSAPYLNKAGIGTIQNIEVTSE